MKGQGTGKTAALERALQDATTRYEHLVTQLSLLRRFDELAEAAGDLDELCRNLVTALAPVIPGEQCSIMLLDVTETHLQLRAGASPFDSQALAEAAPVRFQLGEGIAGHVAQTGEAVFVDDVRTDTRFVPPLAQQVTVGSLLCFPVTSSGKVLGVLNVSHPAANHFTEESKHALLLMAEHAGRVLASFHSRASLQETRQRLDLVLDASRVGLWDWNLATDEVDRGAWIAETFPLEPSTKPSTFKNLLGLLHPDDVP